MPWRSYLGTSLATAMMVIAATALINVLVDPLHVFASPRVEGINSQKPYLTHHRELGRWMRARRACAEGAIFGNSRAEIGLDPRTFASMANIRGAFNHAIPGAGLDLAVRQHQWLAAEDCKPTLVVVGVEFFDDLGRAEPAAAVPPSAAPSLTPEVGVEVALSLKGLRDSFTTLKMQHDPYAPSLTELGFNPLKEYELEVKLAGYFPLFNQRATENFKRWHSAINRSGTSGNAASARQAVASRYVEQLLAQTRPDAQIHLLIYPYHAQIRLMQEHLGLTPVFHQWKRELLAGAKRARSAGRKITVWDFSALSEYSLEPIPAPGDKASKAAWYWEAGHFKRQLGDRMLARVFGEQTAGGTMRGNWGVPLEPHNIDLALAQDEQEVSALAISRSPLAADVQALAGRLGIPKVAQ